MLTTLATALWNALLKILVSLGSEKFMIWVLFKLAEMIKDSTKTTVDDEWYEKVKSTYESQQNKKPQ